MIKHKMRILNKEWLSPHIFALKCFCKGINPAVGQFFQIQLGDGFEHLLNRPISIADYRNDELLLIIKIIGEGTALLSKKKIGDELIVFGPLGKKIKIAKKKSLVVAGGIGVAPLFFLGQKLSEKHIDFAFVFGAKNPEELILKQEIAKLTDRVIYITESGARKKGTALSALREIDISEFEICYACGPKAMLKELQSMKLTIPVQVFCEDFLGCGCGLCLGCAIKYYGEYRRICEDGPVFELRGIEFE